jgi:large subunit ribosomal protein L1
VTFDIAKAVGDARAGKVEYRTDKTANVHVVFGKVSFESDKLKGNLVELTREILRAKPPAAKGVYMKKISISSTMGPGIGLDIGSLVDATKQ